ncbi:hypothetical protein [Rhizobium cremeum]|uniref:hypothetical protein n=1 Tax=Rhizobium cremeum TaxID=2813827 RepID=UPI0013B0347A
MGWRGIVRSAIAASRAAEREAHRRQKQALRQEMSDASANAVSEWEDYLDKLGSLHHVSGTQINWWAILNSPEPTSPVRSTVRSDELSRQVERFKPSAFHFFRGGSRWLKARLDGQVTRALADEERLYRKELADHEKRRSEWADDVEMARKVVDGEPQAIKSALAEFQALSESNLVGLAVEFAISREFIHAVVDVHTSDIVPKFRRKQLASGRLSETKMPIAEFNERYQDYVASVAFKVAGDVFSLLPGSEVYVTCRTQMVDSSTGHLEETPVLSVRFIRETWERLNLTSLDPSDALANFSHAMNFKRTKGFERITPLQSS